MQQMLLHIVDGYKWNKNIKPRKRGYTPISGYLDVWERREGNGIRKGVSIV